MPRIANRTRSLKTRPTTNDRFTVGSTVEGWEVVDSDGRSVSPSYPFEWEAQKLRTTLNNAAAGGHRSLAFALGAIEDDLVSA